MGEEEGGMIWEGRIETYILPYVKQIVSGNLLYDGREPKSGTLWQPRGWEVEGSFIMEGTYVYLPVSHVDVWQKSTQYYNYPLI